MASTARHDALLDLRRSAPSDLPQRWEGGRAPEACRGALHLHDVSDDASSRR